MEAVLGVIVVVVVAKAHVVLLVLLLHTIHIFSLHGESDDPPCLDLERGASVHCRRPGSGGPHRATRSSRARDASPAALSARPLGPGEQHSRAVCQRSMPPN